MCLDYSCALLRILRRLLNALKIPGQRNGSRAVSKNMQMRALLCGKVDGLFPI
jgi:hypothetical protein